MFDLNTELNLLGLLATVISGIGYVAFIRCLGTVEAEATTKRVKVVRAR